MRNGILMFTALAGCMALAPARASLPLPDQEVAALANEVSGATAKQNLEKLVQFHRQRGSRGFHAAAEVIAERARAYGLSDVEILRFPADGKIFYGTQRSRPGWDAERGELTEVGAGKETTLASYAAIPVALAQDSESAELTTELVDVGDGDKEADYAGKPVKGRIVLVAVQPGRVQDLAVGKFGAAGIVSYAQNQTTGWSGDNTDQVRWGHLDTFSPHKTFAFMVSLKSGRALKARLAAGETIRLQASVQAGQHPGHYEVVTATIPGADPRLKQEEIAYSCHLDHQKPGANDNASGCVTILEVARTLQKLIGSGAIARPARTLRFIWPPEIEGTVTLLNARPELASRIRAVVHMDMVGGGPSTQAVFHVTRGPASLPSPIHDVAWSFARWVNAQTYQYAATGASAFPMLSPAGGKEPLRAEDSPFEMGSDHEVYQDASFGIPAIYLNDWPDRYIHTNLDTAENIDPTKLQRVAFIGAASGYALAGERGMVGELAPPGAAAARAVAADDEVAYADAANDDAVGRAAGALVFRRVASLRGPMSVFGYDYFTEHAAKAGLPTPKLLEFEGERGAGGVYAYEALNFADGRRDARQIHRALSAEFGPVPLALVVEYLLALETIGVIEKSP